MKIYRRVLLIVFLLWLGLLVTRPAAPARAQIDLPVDDLTLAEKYAPMLYFHPAELFRPQPVDVLVDNSRLRQARSFWFDSNILEKVSIPDLFNYRDDSYFLDAWYGDKDLSESTNYSFHRFYYETILKPEVGGPPMVTYGRVLHDPEENAIVIQYWLFYYYNDWFNKHEGDWELVQVILDGEGQPQQVVLSQHHGGTRRSWSETQVENDSHPVAYVALGSHANYFWGDEIYPNGQNVGKQHIEIMDRTGSADGTIPQVILIPADVDDLSADLPGSEWMFFGGHWGEAAPQGDFGGPGGPTTKGQQWEQPYTWGIAQPLDTDTWYANRLKVQLLAGDSSAGTTITLQSNDGTSLPGAESSPALVILHRDPDPGEIITAEINTQPAQSIDLIVTWPDPEKTLLTHYTFSDVATGASGRLDLRMSADHPPQLTPDGQTDPIPPTASWMETATWDAPDFVWMVNYLPGGEVVRGVLIALLAGLLPTLAYVGLVYWVDRYEKEPKRLLAMTFLWGALPTLAISLLARLFLQLPAGAVPASAFEFLGSGVAVPLIEETLKGAVVVFLVLRFRREFDNVLDGVIYGSMVGFGFAMSRNIVSLLGSFLVDGFAGLGSAAILTGVIYAFNQATYTAVFGAGLGYARLSQNKQRRRWVPVLAFVVAVTIHVAHNLIVNSAGGGFPSMLLSLLGLATMIVIITWSLRRQKGWIQTELKDVIPLSLFATVSSTAASARAQWRALLKQGYRGWRETRDLHQLCTELAFKRAQARLFPDEAQIVAEAEVLLAEITKLEHK